MGSVPNTDTSLCGGRLGYALAALCEYPRVHVCWTISQAISYVYGRGACRVSVRTVPDCNPERALRLRPCVPLAFVPLSIAALRVSVIVTSPLKQCFREDGTSSSTIQR